MSSTSTPLAYTPAQIGIAACVGGPFAAAWLLVLSRKALGEENGQGDIWLTALTFTGFLLTAFALLPPPDRGILAGLPALLSGLGCGFWADQVLYSRLSAHLSQRGPVSTWWSAVARGFVIQLLSIAVLATLVLGYGLVRGTYR